jgi:rare lipoprotein A
MAVRRSALILFGLFATSTLAEPARAAGDLGRNVMWSPVIRPAPSPPSLITGWATSVVRLPVPEPPRGDIRAATGDHALEGIASFYWQFAMTASGERYDPQSLTAAHKTLPFGTRVRVTNLANGRATVVRINNRGPYRPGRVIDLSEAAADAIDMRARGIVPVRLEVVEP